MKATRKIGWNKKGKAGPRPRIWLQGAILEAANLKPGDKITATPETNKITIRKDPNGDRTVSGKGTMPIIDLLGGVIELAFNVQTVERVTVQTRGGVLFITPAE